MNPAASGRELSQGPVPKIGRAATDGVYGRRPSGSQLGSGAGMRPASPAQSGNAGMLMRRQLGNADGIGFVPLSVLGRALVGRALVLYIDDGPGDRINERGTADQAILAAWTREFRRVSRRCDFSSVTVDVDCLPRFHSPISPLSQIREQAMARECSLVVEECSLIVRESHRTSGAAQGAPSCRPSACAIGAVPMTCALQIRKWTGSGSISA